MRFISSHEYKGHIFDGRTVAKNTPQVSTLYQWLKSEDRTDAFEIRKVPAAVLDTDTGKAIEYEKSVTGVYITDYMGDKVWKQLSKGDVVYFKDFKGNIDIMSSMEFQMNYAEIKEVANV